MDDSLDRAIIGQCMLALKEMFCFMITPKETDNYN